VIEQNELYKLKGDEVFHLLDVQEKEVVQMATRESVEEHLQMAEDTLRYAEDQFSLAKKQEHYNQTEYTKAQQLLETAVIELGQVAHSGNPQQKEQIDRMRLQLQRIQNEMIIYPHH
jgi:esterase/lipase